MTQIGQNQVIYNNQQQAPQHPIKRQMPPVQDTVRIPDYYVVPEDKQSIREQLKNNPMTMMGYEFFLRGTERPIPTLLTWLGVGYGLDAYTKACGGEYNKSLLKRAANLGDSLQNSKLIQSKPIQFIINGFTRTGNAAKNIASHSAILRSLSTPTMPEWKMPKSEMMPHKLKVMDDFFRITDSLHLLDDGKISLDKIVVGKKETEALKKFFKVSNISKIPEEQAVNHVLLSQLGKNEAEIRTILNAGKAATEKTKSEILKTLNNISKDSIKNAHEAISNGYLKKAEYKKLMDALKAGSGKVKVRAGHYGFLGFLTKPFERTIGCDEIYNKLHSIADGAKTATGRFFSKFLQLSHRGLTFGQGKLGLLLLIAPSLVDTGISVAKAEPKEKIGTAVGGFVNAISWVITFPLALKIMHSFGGIRYAGMSKTQITKYREALKAFNEKNSLKGFATKAEYKAAKKQVLDLLKVNKKVVKNGVETIQKQNIFTRAIRKFARTLTLDLETFKAYKNQNIITRTLQKAPNLFKNLFGVPLRFGIWSVLAMFVLEGTLMKGVSKIFGKAYNHEKHLENEENKKTQKKFLKEDLNKRLYETQAHKQSAALKNVQSPKGINVNQPASRGGSPITTQIQHTRDEVDNYSYIPSSENIIPSSPAKGKLDTYTYIPSQENTLKKDDSTNPDARKYIPSQAAANIQKNWDNSNLNGALERADRAEARAHRVLAGDFKTR